MTSLVSPSRRRRTALALVATFSVSAAVTKLAAQEDTRPYADRFVNVVLKTHEGKNVRFYQDLLEGKVVVINFMYATCTGR